MNFVDRYGPWALITGASAGLGAEYARQLAAKGLSLFLVARRTERLRALASEIAQDHKVDVETLSLDLTAEGWREKLIRAIGKREIGLLVNNAGFGITGNFLAMDADRLAQMARLNVEAVTLLSHDWLPKMVERGRGGMVLLASVAGYQPTPYMAAYGATKAFDLMLGESLAVELGPAGVDVITVSPGSTATEFHEIAGVSRSAVGYTAKAENVVKQSLSLLGRRPSFIHGWRNAAMALLGKISPRRMVAFVSGKILKSRLN